MKFTKRLFSFLLSLILVVTACCIPAYVNGATTTHKYNYDMTIYNECTTATSDEAFSFYFKKFPNDIKTVENAIDKAYETMNLAQYDKDYDKFLAIYQWIGTHIRYDMDVVGKSGVNHNTFYYTLVERRGVCEDFALVFNLLCRNAAIKYKCDALKYCDFVSGSTTGGHAWNMVKVDGKWYHVDSSWQAYDNIDFFLMTPNQIAEYGYSLNSQYKTTAFKNSHPTTNTAFNHTKYGISSTPNDTTYNSNLKIDVKKDCDGDVYTITWNKIKDAIVYFPYISFTNSDNFPKLTAMVYTAIHSYDYGLSEVFNCKDWYVPEDADENGNFTVKIKVPENYYLNELQGRNILNFYVKAVPHTYDNSRSDRIVMNVEPTEHSLTTINETYGTGSAAQTYTKTYCTKDTCNYVSYGAHNHIYKETVVDSTCAKAGKITKVCQICKDTKAQTIAKKAHTYATTKATLTKNGAIKCTKCGSVKQTIYYPKTITLAQTSYTYDGKVKAPKVTVKGADGKVIAASNYTVSYASGRKAVGKYAVKITFKGNYSGTKTLYFTINPKGTTIAKLTPASKALTVKWKKQATQTTGYQIQYATNAKFTSAKTVTVAKNSTTSKKITKLTGKKKYYVRVRTYKTVKVNGKSTKIYSSWSKAKSVSVKK